MQGTTLCLVIGRNILQAATGIKPDEIMVIIISLIWKWWTGTLSKCCTHTCLNKRKRLYTSWTRGSETLLIRNTWEAFKNYLISGNGGLKIYIFWKVSQVIAMISSGTSDLDYAWTTCRQVTDWKQLELLKYLLNLPKSFRKAACDWLLGGGYRQCWELRGGKVGRTWKSFREDQRFYGAGLEGRRVFYSGTIMNCLDQVSKRR